MGRRPNTIISEYFLRGEKLPDASNRYKQKCRGCGENFPKGRMDAMKAHLIHECPHVTPEERQKLTQDFDAKPKKSRGNVEGFNENLDTRGEIQSQNAPGIPKKRKRRDNPAGGGNYHLVRQESMQGSFAVRGGQFIDPRLVDGDEASAEDTRFNMPPYQPNLPTLSGPRQSFHPSLPGVNHTTNDGLGTRPVKGVRGQFSQEGRSKVKAVRKLGACLRCRLLKKSCSAEGTPCDECKRVTSARRWTQGCIRDNISSFNHFSARLHRLIAHEETATDKTGPFQPSSKKIRVTNFPNGHDPTPFTELSSLEGIVLDGGRTELRLINTDDVGEQLKDYFKNAVDLFINQKTSLLMNTTLRMVYQVVQYREDSLLSDALLLWIATHVLVDPQIVWYMSSSTSPVDSNDRHEPYWHQDPINHRILTQQLRSLTEEVADTTYKKLATAFEGRLLHRNTNSELSVETFLVAVILQNCIEKTAWLYKSWKSKSSRHDADHNQNEWHEQGVWPWEDKYPGTFIQKGLITAYMVAMMMKNRGAVPEFKVVDGVLKYDDSKPSLVRPASKKGPKKPAIEDPSAQDLLAHLAQIDGATTNDDDQTGAGQDHQGSAAKDDAKIDVNFGTWFDLVNLKHEELRAARAALDTYNELDLRSWEQRFIAELFLPDDVNMQGTEESRGEHEDEEFNYEELDRNEMGHDRMEVDGTGW